MPSIGKTIPITLNTSEPSNCSEMCQTTTNLSPVRNISQTVVLLPVSDLKKKGGGGGTRPHVNYKNTGEASFVLNLCKQQKRLLSSVTTVFKNLYKCLCELYRDGGSRKQ